MPQDRFDELSKALALGSSRRHFIKLLGGSAIGGTIALLGGLTVFAKDASTLRGGKKCPVGTVRCGGVCCDVSGGDLVCVNNVCCLPPHCP